MTKKNNQSQPLKTCFRCGGTGKIDYLTLGSITKPVCRTCHGTGLIEVDDPYR